jgi:hypothetical protein
VDADEVVEALGLEPHPEGGWFRETWRDPDRDGRRGVGTSIYFLLRSGERSHWHRVDADELWLFHAGDPLELSVSEDGIVVTTRVLGCELPGGQRPQGHVPSGAWQSARTLGAWTLVSCTVSPAFRFEGFELAPPGWSPGADSVEPTGGGG